MRLVLRVPRQVLRGEKIKEQIKVNEWKSERSRTSTVLPGEYEVELIPNPRGEGNSWIVLKGTDKGMTNEEWCLWNDSGIESLEVTIRD